MLVYAYQQQREAELTAAQPNSPNRRSTRKNKKSFYTLNLLVLVILLTIIGMLLEACTTKLVQHTHGIIH